MLAVSDDGYIRLSFAELRTIQLRHLLSGLDEHPPAIITGGAIPMAITGYTEWVSNTIPVLTIGWDWQMDAVDKHIRPSRISKPRSNIMLQTIGRSDVGPEKTMVLIETLIDALDWKSAVRRHIESRYAL